jgi:hypothetical protein
MVSLNVKILNGIGWLMWRPGFLISVINTNDRISWVKPVGVGQTMVNLGRHFKYLVNDH